jgi:hypothetical protein
MNNALILHGTNASSQANWFPWLKKQLEDREWKVWVPDLPHPEKPSIRRYNQFLFESKDWRFDRESYIIGHSSGSVAALGVLQKLPASVVIDTCVLVGAFEGDLGRKDLGELYDEPLDFDVLKTKADKFICIHSDNDPHCPFLGAKNLCDKLEGTMIWVKGGGHFNTETDEKYTEFPLALEVLQGSELLG